MKESLYDIPPGCICQGDGMLGMKCEAKEHARLKRTHLRKGAEAKLYARGAVVYMRTAIDSLNAAERELKSSGYRGAAWGVHQANERVKSWLDKVLAELSR